MQLVFEEAIDLTNNENNPEPKNVNQLSIVHEAQKGDITQYYITKESNQAGDKESTALSIYHARTKTTPAYYTYNTYNSLVWNTKKGSRLTRQRISHLGLKAFPNVGAIAFYKLAYRNLSKIVAPVNYVTKKHKGPILSVEVLPTSIQFSITPPNIENTATEDLITYTCYRVNMQWNQFTLEYISYDQVFRVAKPETTGTYSCWCFGYTDDGSVISEDSNVVDIHVQGTRTDWPDVTPGSEDIYIHSMHFDTEGKLEGTLTNGGIVASDNRPPIGDSVIVEQIIPEGTNIANLTVDGVTTRLFAPNSGGGGGIVFDKVQYYNHSGTILYHKEYVEVGGNAEWSTRDIWATTPNGQAVPGILQNITTNLNLYKAGLDKYIDLSEHINTDTDCTMIDWNVDDGNTKIAVDPNDFKFYINNNYVTSITLNSDFYVEFNSQRININQRDNRSRRYGTAIIEGIDCKAFKIRFEGWAPYNNQDDAHLCIWELFLIDTGDAYIHLESVGANANWTGSFTFFGVPYTLNMNNVDVSFYRQESGSSIVWNVINKPYVVIEDPAG
jgi:hypothetical protein